MARGINKAILIGNLGKDPEVRYSPAGSAMANVAIATTEAWKDKTTGDKVEKTEWHRVVFFGRLAEIVAEYLKKGSSVYIEGRLQTRKWQGQDGQDKYTTEIVANEMQMLGGRENGEAIANNGQGAPANTQAQQGNRQAPPPAQSGGFGGNPPDFDDDVPF